MLYSDIMLFVASFEISALSYFCRQCLLLLTIAFNNILCFQFRVFLHLSTFIIKMACCMCLSKSLPTKLWPLKAFLLVEYISNYDRWAEGRWLAFMQSNGLQRCAYVLLHGIGHFMFTRSAVTLWEHWRDESLSLGAHAMNFQRTSLVIVNQKIWHTVGILQGLCTLCGSYL